MESASQERSKSLSWLIDNIKTHGRQSKKVIIYTVNMRQCEQMYVWLLSELGTHAYANPDEVNRSNRLVDMIHSKTGEESVKRILTEFPNGNIRVVVATVAFGLGIQVQDVDIIVNWGAESILVYWQEVGRCARDGHQGYALMYAYPRSLNDCKDNAIKTILAEKCCIRKRILDHFKLPAMKENHQEPKQCNEKCEQVSGSP